MSDNENRYSITKETPKDPIPKDRGAFNERWSDFGKKDLYDQFAEKTAPQRPKEPPAPDPKQEELLHIETTKREIEQLARLYYERETEFKKASRIRWILAFVGFTLVVSYILISIVGGDIKSVFSADIRNILIMLLTGAVITGFHFFINISVFGWLFQKDIAEDRRLANIENRIRELEKELK